MLKSFNLGAISLDSWLAIERCWEMELSCRRKVNTIEVMKELNRLQDLYTHRTVTRWPDLVSTMDWISRSMAG